MILEQDEQMNNSDNPMIFNLNDQMGNNFNNELNRSSQYSDYQQQQQQQQVSQGQIFQDQVSPHSRMSNIPQPISDHQRIKSNNHEYNLNLQSPMSIETAPSTSTTTTNFNKNTAPKQVRKVEIQ